VAIPRLARVAGGGTAFGDAKALLVARLREITLADVAADVKRHKPRRKKVGSMLHDVIVVGGSSAGIAAGLQLGRARQRVLVVDAGQRRNRFARAAHGFLGQDGRDAPRSSRRGAPISRSCSADALHAAARSPHRS
jgi:hypothetical protein